MRMDLKGLSLTILHHYNDLKSDIKKFLSIFKFLFIFSIEPIIMKIRLDRFIKNNETSMEQYRDKLPHFHYL